MQRQTTLRRRRRGFSLLETQVALVLFGITLSGIAPLVSMQLRQLRSIEDDVQGVAVYQMVRDVNPWAEKLGVPAQIKVVPASQLDWLTQLAAPAPAMVTGVNTIKSVTVTKSPGSATVTVSIGL